MGESRKAGGTGMKVYHGGTVVVKEPLAGIGRAGLDFGQGFYVTVHRKQACEWASRMADRRQQSPVLNEYQLDRDTALKEYKCLVFEKYDKAWLDFIAGNRKGRQLWKGYDWIEGGVADDRVVDTVESYIAGLMGVEEALKRLTFLVPNNQICLLNQCLIDRCLRFVNYTLI